MALIARKVETEEEYKMLPYLDGPWRNDACLGYMIMTMHLMGHTDEFISKYVSAMKRCFDNYTIEEAAQEYYKFY